MENKYTVLSLGTNDSKDWFNKNLHEQQLRQLFKNNSDCYADTGEWVYNEDLVYPTSGDKIYIEGDIIQAMTEDKFIELLKEILKK